jgi:hypothetical protein
MSTKIYHAWKVPVAKLNLFIDKMRAQMIPAVQDRVVNLMSTLPVETALGPEPEWLAQSPRGYERAKLAWRAGRRFDIVEKACKQDAKSVYRSDLDMQCFLNIWLHSDGYAYVMPVCDYWMLKGIAVPKWARDYSYWNNTDAPKGMSEKRWNERRDTWNKLCCGTGTSDHNSRRLCHSIIEVTEIGFGWTFREGCVEKYENKALGK